MESILGIPNRPHVFDSGPDPVPRLLQAALADLNDAGNGATPGEYYSPPVETSESPPVKETPPSPAVPATVTILPPGTAGFAAASTRGTNSMLNGEYDAQARAAAIRAKQQAHNELGAPPAPPPAESGNVGAVVGGVLGALALVGIVIGAVVWSRKRERAHRYSRYNNEEI